MNLMFVCSPSGFTISVGAWPRGRWLWSWATRLIADHQAQCPYCLFEKDAQSGRDVGQ